MIQSDTGFYGYTPYPRECTADIDRELDQVFGPDEGGSSSSSVIALCEDGSLGVQDESTTEISSSPTNGGEVLQEKEDVSDETDSTSTLTEDEQQEEVATCNMPPGEETSGSQDRLLDYISPTAQKLTDDILKECQASISSLSNQGRVHDTTFQTNAVIHNNSTVRPGDNHTAMSRPPSTRPQSAQDSTKARSHSEDSAKARSRSAHESTKARPQSAQDSTKARPRSAHESTKARPWSAHESTKARPRSAHESTSNMKPDSARCSASRRPKSAQDSRHISARSSSTHIFIELTSLHPPTDDDSASTHS